MSDWILQLADVTLADLARAGGKAAHLGHLRRAGLPVPDGFVLTTAAYDAAAARQFRSLPQPLWTEIRAAYRQLKGPVAVRSSATAEDLPGASAAGQQETVLDVAGETQLRAAILRCFASLWSERAVQYRERMAIATDDLKLAVLVQRMVPARTAGVLFTAHPVRGERSVCVIEAVRGAGEALVSGAAVVDRFVAGKADGRISAAEPADPTAPVLTGAEVADLVAMGRQIEQLYGTPQDIEWALEGTELRILQARPITTLPAVELERPALKRSQLKAMEQLAERFAEALRPFDADVCFRGVTTGVSRTVGHFGLRMDASPERIFHLQDGVPVMIYPTAAPRPTLRLPFGMLWALWLLRRRNPARWQEEEHPRLRRRITELEVLAAHTAELDDQALLYLIDQGAAFGAEAFYSRRNYAPLVILPNRLRRRVKRLFPAEADAVYADLLSGIAHVTTRMNRALQALAAEAGADPSVRDVIVAADPTKRLAGTPFLARAQAFLAEFGSRETEGLRASWGEEPAVFWSALRSLMRGQAPAADPTRFQTAVRRCIHELPDNKRVAFRQLVDRTRALEAAREESHFMIMRGLPVARAGARELGARFAERGLIDRPDDIFFLRRPEIAALAEGQAPADLRQTVARRRDVYAAARVAGLVPPDWRPAPAGAQVLSGVAVSAGVVEGTARVIRGPEEFHRLQPGDVLVCRSTNPAWTPLFGVAAAVVAETGGLMTHAAIVAREYGVPAVMGARGALALIEDGRRIRVDGRTGEVRLV